VDAPHHFLNDGRTIETLSLEVLTGPARVIQLLDRVRLITSSILESTAIPPGTTRLLIKTHNSSLWKRGEKSFQTNFTAIAPDGAKWLIDQGVRLVGVDYLSVAPYKAGIQTHKALLQGGVIILEGLNLSEVDPGMFDLFCLPLNLVGSDGAPARVILIG
jgi:arylformamidase